MGRQTITIDQIGADHSAQLADLQAATFADAYADVHAPEDIEVYCTAHYTSEIAAVDLLSNEIVCCIGQIDSEPSGYYMVKHQACPIDLDSESSELRQIYILRSAYGGELGQALYEHALESIRSLDRQWIWLCVSDINYRAQAFYEKLRFKKVGTGPVLRVGKDTLPSSILALEL